MAKGIRISGVNSDTQSKISTYRSFIKNTGKKLTKSQAIIELIDLGYLAYVGNVLTKPLKDEQLPNIPG